MPEVEREDASGPAARSGGLYRVVRAGALVSLALWAFVLTRQLIDHVAPLHVPLLSVKWAHFLAHRDEYTTVYIGTSLVRYHIVPEVVDAEMRARGIRERSFNLGMSRMSYPEARLLVERLIALRPAKLRRVVLDPHLFAGAGRRNDLSSRHLWWHTPEETFTLLERLYHWKGPRGQRNQRMWIEAQALLIMMTAAGRVAEEFRGAWDPGSRPPDEDDAPVTEEGYRALDTMHAASIERKRERLLRSPRSFERRVKRRMRSPRTRQLARHEREALDDLVRSVADAGWQPVVLESASLAEPIAFSPAVREHAIVLSFNDPVRFAELYSLAARYDENHLNNMGARATSLMLGDMLAAAILSREPPPSEPTRGAGEPEPR